MTRPFVAVVDELEPDAKAMTAAGETDDQLVALASIAISLKRIADGVMGDERNSGILHAIFDISSRGS